MNPNAFDEPVALEIREASHIFRLQGLVRFLSRTAELGAEETFQMVIGISELAQSLLFDRGGGLVSLRLLRKEGAAGFEVVLEGGGPALEQEARIWMDECVATPTAGTGMRILARKWQPCLRLERV